MYNFCVCVSMYTTDVCNKSTDSLHFMFVSPPTPISSFVHHGLHKFLCAKIKIVYWWGSSKNLGAPVMVWLHVISEDSYLNCVGVLLLLLFIYILSCIALVIVWVGYFYSSQCLINPEFKKSIQQQVLMIRVLSFCCLVTGLSLAELCNWSRLIRV